jgi:hypothetical protein
MTHPEIVAMKRAVALGKVNAFASEAYRIAVLACVGVVEQAEAVDALHDCAIANNLEDVVGEDIITEIIADAITEARSAGANFREAA